MSKKWNKETIKKFNDSCYEILSKAMKQESKLNLDRFAFIINNNFENSYQMTFKMKSIDEYFE